MTPKAFSEKWNRKAEETGCPARAEFQKRSVKTFEFRGEVDAKGFEIWWPIPVEKWDRIVQQYPDMGNVQ